METYGDLKKILKSISRKQKGEKIGKVTVDAIIGNIPGIGQAKSVYDLVKASFGKPDTVKTNSWLDKLDVDDHMSAIVDDTVENDFLEFISKEIEGESDDTKLDPGFNMSKKMQAHLKKQHSGRSVDGVSSFNLAKEQKDHITNYLNNIAYKFPKGYPDMNNAQDVLLLESLISETIDEKFSLKEANTAEGNKFIKDIIIKNSEELGFELDILDDKNRLYFKGIPSKGQREMRLELLKLIGNLFPDNDFKNTTKETPTFTVVIDGQKHTFTIKGAGSEFGTSTIQKEGLVIFFYNSPINELFTPESLIENVKVLNGEYYDGIGTKPDQVKLLLSKYTENIESVANDKTALAVLNDPLSSAIAIKEAYGNKFPLITGEGIFNEVKSTGAELSGLDADKWNPGDVFLQLADIKYSKSQALSDPETLKPITEYNKNFVIEWGKKDNIDNVPTSFVSISLKNERAAAGKGKGYLKGFDPASEYGKIKRGVTSYNMTDDEKGYSDENLKSEITKLKQEIESEIESNGKGVKYNPGPTPTKRSQLLAKYASLKILKFILIEVAQGGGLGIEQSIGAIASYAASLTGVNCSFFKISGNSKGEATVKTFPAESSAELTKGKEIEIIDRGTAGSIQIKLSLTSLDSITNSTDEFDFIMNIRSNGTGQNTIELNIAK